MMRADYGVQPTVQGMRRFFRQAAPVREIKSAGQYVAACRAVGTDREFCFPWHPEGVFSPLDGEGRVDGRLVAAGWNHESPTRWVRGEGEQEPGLVLFARYWARAVARPETIGSSCNAIGPEHAYAAMRMGVPASAVLALGALAVNSRERGEGLPVRLRRLPRRRIQRLVRAARAARRTSIREEELILFSTKVLEALGRLCPELQRVAIEGLKRDARWPLDADGHWREPRPDMWGARDEFDHSRVVRVRDIPWQEVVRVQQQLAGDSTGRVRAAWATGKRRESLFVVACGEPARWRAKSSGRRPNLGERCTERSCSCPSGCPDCTREVTAVERYDGDRYWDRCNVTWSWLPDESGRRRLYDTTSDIIVSTGVPLPPATLASWLCPSYSRVPDDFAARLARGESTVQVAGGSLTRAEAHDWLSAGAPDTPLEWLQRGLPVGTPALRSEPVTRWLLDVERRGQWDALTKEREIVGPGGQRARVRYLDRVDEIQDGDLDRGPQTGVHRAFERAAERCGAAWLERARQDHRVLGSLPRGWRLYTHSMRHLCTPAALAKEGDEMQHCVGGYESAVQNGQSIILSIRVCGERSTVELASDGRVLQHRGAQNSAPHPLCERVLARFQRRIRR